MARHRTGAAIAKWKVRNGKRVKQWFACVSYFDEQGKRRQWIQKSKDNTKTAARELAKKMLGEMEGQGEKAIDAANMTFAQLADYYQQTYLVEPEYVDGRKVAGYRSRYELQLRLNILKNYFGKTRIKSITHGDLERFKAKRLKTPVVFGKNTRGTDKLGNLVERQRSIGTVHKELSLLRRVFNVSVANGWILRNPFVMGSSLINPGDERHRERILTREEEEKLLAVCTGAKAHLRPIIIMALDTGMRRGEIFKLKWADINFENGLINIQAFNTKTLRQRQVAITSRLAQELHALWGRSTLNPDELVFGVANVKKAFSKARVVAGIPDLRFHDLRHTHATRLVSGHVPLSEVGRVLGHTQANTTYRYVNANVETARRAAAALDEFNKSAVEGDIQVIN
jgi:integrase